MWFNLQSLKQSQISTRRDMKITQNKILSQKTNQLKLIKGKLEALQVPKY